MIIGPQLIALTGIARCGKDDLATPLVERGWVRLAFGDEIKRFYAPYIAGDEGEHDLITRMRDANPELTWEQCDDFTKAVLIPFYEKDVMADAFTEDDVLKSAFRPILEHGGDMVYEHVSREFFRRVDAAWSAGKSVINPRLCRVAEARRWAARRGELILIDCLHREAVSQWEKDVMVDLKRSGLITDVLGNWGTADEWLAFAEQFAEERAPRVRETA